MVALEDDKAELALVRDLDGPGKAEPVDIERQAVFDGFDDEVGDDLLGNLEMALKDLRKLRRELGDTVDLSEITEEIGRASCRERVFRVV